MAQTVRRKPRKRPATTTKGATSEETEAVGLHASLRRRLTQIRASDISLLVTYGERGDGSDVFVPLADWQFFGAHLANIDDDELEGKGHELFSALLSLDNVAYLLNDMSFDVKEIVRLVSQQARSGIAPLEDRMHYTAKMLKRASAHLLSAVEQIEADISERERKGGEAPEA